MLLLQRIANNIVRLGEEFTVGANTYKGVFKVLDPSTMRTYLNDVEAMGVTVPGLILYTTPDTPVNQADTVTRDGVNYYAYRSVIQKVMGVPVARMVILG